MRGASSKICAKGGGLDDTPTKRGSKRKLTPSFQSQVKPSGLRTEKSIAATLGNKEGRNKVSPFKPDSVGSWGRVGNAGTILQSNETCNAEIFKRPNKKKYCLKA